MLISSRLEGARTYNAACAATTLIHYTPPPFDDVIVPSNFHPCQAFVKNRL